MNAPIPPRTAAEDIQAMNHTREVNQLRRTNGQFAGWQARELDSFSAPEEFSAISPEWAEAEFNAVTGRRMGTVYADQADAPEGTFCGGCGGEKVVEPDGSAFHLDAYGRPTGCRD